jgi:hypothetical protein
VRFSVSKIFSTLKARVIARTPAGRAAAAAAAAEQQRAAQEQIRQREQAPPAQYADY